MKLLIAVSADGFVATGPSDNMRWTGLQDKAVFRLLTLTSDQVLLAGRVTAELMPTLSGRTLVPLSLGKGGISLEEASIYYPDAWLIGGYTVALEALHRGYIKEAIISRVGSSIGSGYRFEPLAELLPERPCSRVVFEGVEVQIYKLRND